MATDTRATTFVTGAAGFIDSRRVKVLVARRRRVFGLTDSIKATERVGCGGGVPIMGHLLEPGEPSTARLRAPAVATRLVVGPVLADQLQTDAAFSNVRLRGTGFRVLYPTLEQGLQQVLGALHE